MKRQEMLDYLSSLDPASRYPTWIISYKRPGTAPLLNRMMHWSTAETVNVLVLESEAAAYRKAYPMMQVHYLPDDEVKPVGKARKAAMDMAYMLTGDVGLLLDDDLLEINFLFERTITRGANKGEPCSGHSLRGDHKKLPELEELILAGFSDVGREVFRDNPRAVLGGAIKQHMSFDVKNHQTKYIINGGVSPRQMMLHHFARYEDMGIALNTDLFGVHGDDIGTVAEVLKAGADCFAVPSFIYETWPESVNIKESVIRDAKTAPTLHELEWDALQTYPIRDYLRVKRSIIDGSYEWGDVNWSRLHKLRGTKPLKVLWNGDDPELLDVL